VAAVLVPAANPAGIVYGLLATGAVLAAERTLRETYLDTLASEVLAALVYWLLHAYAGLLGERLSEQRPLRLSSLLRELADDWSIVRGAAIPIAALLIAYLAGASQRTGEAIALWVAIGGLVVFELLAAVRVNATWRELVFETFVGVTMGLGVLALAIVLH
jgi:hypothetical protein